MNRTKDKESLSKEPRAFVSSTYLDLYRHRQQAIVALQKAGFAIDPMEAWTADSAEPTALSLERLESVDLFVLLVAWRRGNIPNKTLNLSITQLEYNEAIKHNIDCLVLLLDEEAPWSRKFDESKEDREVERWRKYLKDKHVVDNFTHEPQSVADCLLPALTRWMRKRQFRQLTSVTNQLLSPPDDFTGREAELDELRKAVQKNGVTILGLFGMAGVGKSALALKLADELKLDYPDGQIFLDLKGTSLNPLSSAEVMTYVIQSLRQEMKPPESDAELRSLYLSVLAEKRILIFLDNAANDDQVAPLLPPKSCILLITSRFRFALPGLLPKNLNTLPTDQARDLLQRIAAPRSLNEQDANMIVQLCGYLPFAIRLVGGTLRVREDVTPEYYAKQLTSSGKPLESVDGLIELSYNLLDSKLQRLWILLAVFPGTLDRSAALAVWGIEPNTMEDYLGKLFERSLVEWGNDCYRLHDLTRMFLDSRLGEQERVDAQRRHAVYYLSKLREVGKLYNQGHESLSNGLALFDRESDNIFAAQKWAAAYASQDDEAAMLCCEYANTNRHVLGLRVHPQERLRWLESALQAALRLHNRLYECRTLGNMGITYDVLGNIRQAFEHDQKYLALAEEIHDREHECRALGNLGNDYHNLGDELRAIAYHEKSLLLARVINNQELMGRELGNLGNVYKNLKDYQRAIECHEQSLVIAQKIGNRLYEATSLGNLGSIYNDLGDKRRAIEFYEKKLIVARDIRHREGEENALRNLGNIYNVLGERKKAIEYYKQLLVVVRNTKNRKSEAEILRVMANTYSELREKRLAIEFYEKCLSIAREIDDKLYEASLISTLCVELYDIGEKQKAFEYYKNYLSIVQKLGGQPHVTDIISLLNFLQTSSNGDIKQEDRPRVTKFLRISLLYEKHQGNIKPIKCAARLLLLKMLGRDMPRFFYTPQILLRGLAVFLIIVLVLSFIKLINLPSDNTSFMHAPSSLYAITNLNASEGSSNGLQVGDLLRSINGYRVDNRADVDMFSKTSSDAIATVKVFRPISNKEITCKVRMDQLGASVFREIPRAEYVVEVYPKGAADNAGIQKGDLIITIGNKGLFEFKSTLMRRVYIFIGKLFGQNYSTAFSVNDLIRQSEIGQSYPFGIIRKNQDMTIELIMGKFEFHLMTVVLYLVVIGAMVFILIMANKLRPSLFIRALIFYFILIHFLINLWGVKYDFFTNFFDVTCLICAIGFIIPLTLLKALDRSMYIILFPIRRMRYLRT